MAAPEEAELPIAPAAPDLVAPRNHHRGDAVFSGLTRTVAVVVLSILAVMTMFLVVKAWPALRTAGPRFLTERQWFPDDESHRFGVAALLWGTVLSSTCALLIAVPVALGTALYITECARPAVGRWIAHLVDLLAAVPSVVYGLWGLLFLVPRLIPLERWLAHHLGFVPFFGNAEDIYGKSIFAASVVLALMVLPIVAAISREVFRQVPDDLREAALALGATRWEVVRISVMPTSRSGVAGAVVLGLGRVT